MFLRETTSKRKYGAPVKYLELVENHWDSDKKRSVTRVIYNFGRLDRLPTDQIRALGQKLLSYINDDAAQPQTGIEPGLTKELGILYVVEHLWRRLKLDEFFKRELKKHKYEAPIEQALLGLVSNRCCQPRSKLSAYEWLQTAAYFPGGKNLQLHQVYRSLDFLEAHHDDLEEALFWQVCHLLNRQVDLIFFDTTSTYFEIEEADTDDLRRYGYPHGSRRDRPQILIGLAVNHEGLPLASEVFPGNTADVKTVQHMIDRTKRFTVNQCIFVSDRGTVSEDNLTLLTTAGFDYIVGVKFRTLSDFHDLELPPMREFTDVNENLKVTELLIDSKRYIVCLNPREARKDRALREKWLARVEELLPAINSKSKPAELVVNHRVMKRLVQENADGTWGVNEDKIRAEERFDGMYILRTSQQDLSATKVAQGYKSLLRVERAFHYLKSFIELRPCYHWTEIRIKGHVLVCVLAYLMERLMEIESGNSWPKIHALLTAIHLTELKINNETLLYRSGLTDEVTTLFKSLKIKAPPRILPPI